MIATRKIKEHPNYHHIPVVFCTSSDHINIYAAEAKADATLSKPFDIDDLVNIVTEYTQKERLNQH